MTNTAKISVIITTKNRIKYLQETIDTFLKQTLPPYEIIIVDDKSTDGTREILEKEYGNKLKIVINTRGGLSAGRNIGFENASGDYIKVFDDDDVISSNSLETQFKSLIDSGREFVYSPYVKAKLENNTWIPTDVLMHYNALPESMSIHQFMIKGGILVLPSCLFTKKLIDKTGPYNENIITYEDWDFLWKLGHHEPYPAHTNESLMIYRQHSFQMTNGMLDQNLINKDKVTILEDALKYVSENRNEFNLLDKPYLQYRLFETLDFITDSAYVASKLSKKPQLFFLYSFLYRLENKYQRILSKSNWTKWHGVANIDPISISTQI